VSDPVDLSQFLGGFLVEADEHLRLAGRNLLVVEADLKHGRSSPRAVRDLYRSLHTIKGLAAMVGVEPIVDVAHAMESVLRGADRRAGQLPANALESLIEGLRAIEQRVGALARGATVQPAPRPLIDALGDVGPLVTGAASVVPVPLELPSEIAEKLGESERAQLTAADDRRAVRVDFVPSPARAAEGLTITRVRERIGAVAEIVKVVPLSRPSDAGNPGGLVFALLLLTGADDATLAQAVGGSVESVRLLRPARAAPVEIPLAGDDPFGEAGASRGVVRVEVSRLDEALEKLSALVVTRFRLARAVSDLAATGADVRALRQIVQENTRQLRDLRGAIMRARMIRVSEMLERVPLLVRGLARSTGKEVALDLDTGHAELDKAVAERVFPAVVHLVRNALDHGIERPAERAQAGKSPTAALRVSAFERSSTQLELTIEDDGRGVDAAALARRAGRELPTSDEGLLALLTLPGLSTLEAATTTSGRGMGMNIVKRTIVDDLGGEIAVRTAPGKGTTFVLRIPLTITIVDAFSFRCGQQPFVVPVSLVDEIVEINPADVTRAPSGKGRAELRMLERRGVAVPLVRLDNVFRMTPEGNSAPKAIVVRRNGQPFAFEVDQMLGQQEVVVRPLEDPLIRRPGIVGSTDLGDGQPTLVLDLVSLSANLSRRRTDLRS
jgi:two-component system chemotaxis sensor kinase CheA